MNLPRNATVTYTLVANISAGATGSLANTATVTVPAGVTDPTPANNSATDTDTLTPTADLSITKTDGATTAVPGAAISYTIIATNNGPSDVTGATVADTLPATIGGVSWSCAASSGSSCTASGTGNINVAVNLLAGGTATFTVNGTVSSAATGTLSNTATITAPAGVTDPTLGNNSATDTDTLAPQVTLAVGKTDGSANYTPGGAATYTITVTNTGASNASNVTVSDALPAGVTLSANATCSPSGTANCGTVTGATGETSLGATGASIAAGGGNALTFTVPVSFDAALLTDPLINTASATDTVTGATASGSDSDTRVAQVTLALSKTDGSSSYTPGGTATYTITATDTGASDADNVSVIDVLPAGLTLTANVSCVANGNAACGTVVGAIGQTSFSTTGARIAAGSGNSLVFTVPITFAAGMVVNPLINTANATDLATGATISASDSDTLAAQVNLAVTKTDGSTTYTPGGTATYTVTVTDGGLSDASNVTVSDALPAGVTLTGTVACVANGTANCGTVTGAAGETSFGTTGAQIGAGSGNSLVFMAPVSFAAAMTTDPLVNTANAIDVLSGANGAGSDSDARATDVSLSVNKTDNSATYTPGGVATYTITVKNTGVSNALNLSVSDVMPTGVTLTGSATCTPNGSANCGIVTGAAGANSFGASGASLAAGAANSLVFTLPVAFAAALADDPLVNSATANDLASGASGSGSDSDTRAAAADLSVTKSDGSTTYTPGGTATYTITVTNVGPSDAMAMTVSDPLPVGVTLTGTASCIAAGAALCGTVTGSSGQTSFGSTGAQIPAGAGNSLTFTAPVAFASALTTNPLVNTVTVTDPSSAMAGSASDSDALVATADLSITKTDGVSTVIAGATTTYTIVVSNSGPSDAAGAQIKDTLPAAISSASYTAVGSGGASGFTAAGTGNINDVANLPVGSTITYTLIASISAAATGVLSNTATVTAPAGVTDPTPANNSAIDTDTLSTSPTATLAISKSDGSTSYTPGGTATYTITVTNSGPATATNVTVTDNLPAGVTLAGNASCVATGLATCGVVAGATGASSFSATGATITAGAGNKLVYSLPVKFSTTLTTNPLINSASASDPAATSVASVSDSNVRNPVPVTKPALVPVNDPWALAILAGLILLAGAMSLRLQRRHTVRPRRRFAQHSRRVP